MKQYKPFILVGGVILILLLIFWLKDDIGLFLKKNTVSHDSLVAQDYSYDKESSSDGDRQVGVSEDYEIIASNLDTPWSIIKMDDNSFLISERGGVIKKVAVNGNVEVISTIIDASEKGEGGLLGMVLHPNFPLNNYIYIYLTYTDNNIKFNKVVRGSLVNNEIKDWQTIVDKIPGAGYHNGGRIKFGPDNNLYIATGDAQNGDNSQDINSLAGKILRVDENGQALSDNPFASEVYSYGHRNVQGLAFDDNGRLWATEHGRSGALSGLDELNIVDKGANYGWPIIEGDEAKEGMRRPIIHSGPSKTWAPSGATYLNNYIYFVGLRGEALYQADISDRDNVKIREYFSGHFGRLRDVIVGNDNSLYLISNNTDGSGKAKEDDDKLIKVYLK